MRGHLQVKENKTVLLLVSILILIVALAISQSGWTEDLDAIVFVTGGAIVIGLLISQSLLPPLIAHLFSVIIGAAWSFWVVSQLLPDVFTWRLRWQTMMSHIQDWYSLAREGGVIYDNLMFILQMGFLIWLLGYLTIWFLFRSGKIWLAVIPSGIVLLMNLYYAPKDLTTWFITYLLVALLLIVRFNLFEYESRWRIEHVHFRSDISFDFLRNGLIFSVVVIALAWFTPAVSEDSRTTMFDRFDRQWRGIQEEWNRLFAGLNYKPQASGNPNTYTQAHALGGARLLSEQPVMYVQAPGGRYWRAVVYDQYDGDGWLSHDEEQVRFTQSNRSLALPFYEAREPFTQTYTSLLDGLYILYAMGSPMSINRATVARTNFVLPEQMNNIQRRPWIGRSGPWLEEVTYIESDARLQAGVSYQVVSQMSAATKEQLQTDPADYPEWVKERYLDIPDSTPKRVKDLAREITAQADNPYDKAEVIERYLRDALVYNEKLEAPPASRDKVDYILFEAKQAYCDYYATSMIVMLRSLGIPARFAAGFARGKEETLENQERVYMVRNLDAHSWVEVYFPTYGWIEFEPTSAQPLIFRQTDALTPFRNPGRPDDFLEDDPFNPMDRLEDAGLQALGDLADGDNFYTIPLPFLGAVQIPKTIVKWGLIGVLVLAVGTVGWRIYNAQHISARSSFSGDVYFAMLKLAQWMGLAKRPSQTPYEHASILAKNLPDIQAEVNFITGEFVRSEFSPRQTTQETRAKLLAAWHKMRPVLYRAIFDRRVPKIRLPFRW